ncbi:DNA polymerase [Spirillospora sp. NPDC047279]|uniref:DNA polymerase n=1 Tax=Spirillospora sp. NPDC047279 TaxID=3155478 RepID=UPI0033F66324
MKTQTFNVAGRAARVNILETAEDVLSFQDFIRRNQNGLAFDTETTGTNIYKPGWKWRLAQFGNAEEAYVLPVENSPYLRDLVGKALRYLKRIFIHNATYDLLVVDKELGIPVEELYPKSTDTGVISRLVDSRAFKEGGTGHKLEELIAAYLDQRVAKEVKGSITEMAKAMKVSKEDFYRLVPLDHEGYNLYAGADVITTFMLANVLTPKVPTSARKLITYEHDLARICAEIQRDGFILDTEYTQAEAQKLAEIETYWEMQAEAELLQHTVYEGETFYDLDETNWGSTQQMALAFMDRGIYEFTFTDKGQLQVDEAFLNHWADKGDQLAEAIREGKKAGKWRKTWFESFLENAGADGRCHASINTMQARTARMSITGIPAQTLPSGDPYVRNCFLAEVGHRIASIDYSNMELRVMAALSGDPVMTEAFVQGKDLHQITADAAGVERSGGKTGNFSKAFGGGAQAIADGAGVLLEVGQRISDAFDETYKGVTAYSKKLQKQARRFGYVETATGRRLYVDKQRPYSALNYVVQSSSRDITGAALVRLDRAGYTPYMRLPIHDEVLFSFPEERAEEMAADAARIMTHVIKGLVVPTDPELAGRSWGSIYEGDTKH